MSASETRLSVKGMKCDGCIARAGDALGKVPGVVEALFDLKAGTALVKGNADPQAIAARPHRHGLSGRTWEQLAPAC